MFKINMTGIYDLHPILLDIRFFMYMCGLFNWRKDLTSEFSSKEKYSKNGASFGGLTTPLASNSMKLPIAKLTQNFNLSPLL